MTSVSTAVVWPVLFGIILVASSCSNPAQTTSEDATNDANNSTEENEKANTGALDDNMSASSALPVPANDQLSAEDKMIDTLIRYRWVLAGALDDNSQPLTSLMAIKNQVTTSFNQRRGKNTLNYSVGCNTMSAGYVLKDNLLTIENSMSTKMSCADLDLVENRLNVLMQGVNELTLVDDEDSPMLTQVTDDSVTLLWRGKLTAKAKYGSKSETVFWAIDAGSEPCKSNSAQMCLQVRSIDYDDQGLKAGEGERVEFAGTIDGYEHDENFEQVLRLHRYKVNPADSNSRNQNDDQAPADDNYAYVLDTIIEQTSVR